MLASLAAGSVAEAQSAPTATVTGTFTFPVPDGSKLNILNHVMAVCAEIQLGANARTYRAEVRPGGTCTLADGDQLGFFLVYPNGFEPLAPADGQPVLWKAGATISVDLVRVKCADPCAPPLGGGPSDAQGALPAVVTGTFTMPVPDGSTLLVTNPGMLFCAEIPLGAKVTTFRAEVRPNGKCVLRPGDTLGFWLRYPNGGIEPVQPPPGQSSAWQPGGTLNVSLGRVPCPAPCLPPSTGGPPDAAVQLPTTGAGPAGGPRWPALALLLLLVPPALLTLRRRRRA